MDQLQSWSTSFIATTFDDNGEDPPTGPPGSDMNKFQGPWLTTQLTLSLSIGIGSFLFFCFARRVEKWKVLYSPRTLLKGFSPHGVHDTPSFFGWILPTLRTSEFTILQIVGLDAAVLLSFLRTSFLIFLTCTILAWSVLVPINYRENGTSEGVPPYTGNHTHDHSTLFSSTSSNLTATTFGAGKAFHGSTVYLTSHLIFTYLFTLITLLFLNRNWTRYIPLRQLFSLELAHSIPARTVMVTSLPPHLRSERALAEYFEGIHLGESGETGGLGVESVTVTRAVGGMQELLENRTKKLRKLEEEWAKWLGNPVPVEGKKKVWGYDAQIEVERILEPGSSPRESVDGDAADDDDVERGVGGGGSGGRGRGREGRLIDTGDGEDNANELDDSADLEARLLTPSRPTILNPNKKRPMLRPGWFRRKVDALDWYAEEFRKADEDVKRRRKGKFRPTGVSFVTFQSLAAAQIVAQTVHYPSPSTFQTELAPEPRDIQWFNLSLSSSAIFVRKILVVGTLLLLLSVWSVPVAYLAKLLSWDSIEEAAPKLAKWIGKSPRLRGFVQTSLPSLALVAFNNFLPFFLEALSVFQGLQARSWIEYSMLKKYHISLLFTTLFVFITSSTYALLQEISESPATVLSKLATTLPAARNFFVSYVMLSGLAMMPLQLLELATVIPRAFYQAFLTRTPRDHAELNSPTMANLGVVYPQALLMFTLGMTYSIITPLILPFTTLYFGIAYLVYKYKFLFVYYRPYESRGQAWPLAYNRMGWALLVFQVFMLGLFTVRKAFLLSALIVPLLLATSYAIYRSGMTYGPLARFVNLSQACEIAHGGAGDIVKLRRGHPVTRSQTHLNRGRYKHSGEGVYVVGKNSHTDYAQPPLSDAYPGVLNTGSRLYNHPALSGALPEPWLPVLATPSPSSTVPDVVTDAVSGTGAVVVDLRRRWSIAKRVVKNGANAVPGINIGTSPSASSSSRPRRSTSMDEDDPSRAWRGSSESVASRRSTQEGIIGHAEVDSGTEDEDEDEEEEGEGLSRYSTYWVRGKHGQDPGSFPPNSGDNTESEDEG